jgi:putative metal-binding protein
MRRAFILGAAVVALLTTATSARAATVRATPQIQGAGTVTTTSYTCSNADQRSSFTKTDCAQTVVVNDPLPVDVSMTLTAAPAAFPAGQWEFVRWDGCASTLPGNLCVVTAGAFTAKSWTPKAVFRDVTAPTLVSGPTENYSTTAERAVLFFWSTNEGTTAQCRVGTASFQSCTSGRSIENLPEGDHTFDLRVTDASGNLTTASRGFKIVDTAITGGPANNALTNSADATFDFSTIAGNAFECRRDGAAFASCPGTSKSYTGLSEGQHTFEVRAVNGSYFDRIAAKRTWTIDTTPPVVALLANALTPGEGVVSALTNATFAFEAPGATLFQCSLDHAAFTACSSAKSYSGLGSGQHTFAVRAIDAAGNVGLPVERHWSIAVPDADSDGYNALADCNDGDATVNPGRAEVLNNTVDENCDGKKEFDRDFDGARADRDCDDHNAARSPDRAEIPGNGIDDDCDGADLLNTMSPTLAASWKAGKKSTVLNRLALVGAPLGSQVVVKCTGRRCPRKTLALQTTKLRQSLKPFTKKKLRPGTVLTVTVSKPGYATVVKTLKIRAGKAPKLR